MQMECFFRNLDNLSMILSGTAPPHLNLGNLEWRKAVSNDRQQWGADKWELATCLSSAFMHSSKFVCEARFQGEDPLHMLTRSRQISLGWLLFFVHYEIQLRFANSILWSICGCGWGSQVQSQRNLEPILNWDKFSKVVARDHIGHTIMLPIQSTMVT